MTFSKDVLKLDCEKETTSLCSFVKEQVVKMRCDGVVVGLSGGIDSAVCAAVCVEALGKDNVLGLLLPEKDSNPKSEEYGAKHARKLGIATERVEITPTLTAFGTYAKRDKVVKGLFPEYTEDHLLKLVLPQDLLAKDSYNFYRIQIDDGKGNIQSARLDKEALNGIVAATNTKHRTRTLHLYYFAEAKNLMVGGTTNRTETVQGFFVKYGDGGVDIEPLAHLYKTQIYQLAEHLGVIREIIERAPSPDTFSSVVSDEEFYFRIPFDKLDLLLFAWENSIDIKRVGEVMDLSEEQVKRAFRDFAAKYRASWHLRQMPPTLTDDVDD